MEDPVFLKMRDCLSQVIYVLYRTRAVELITLLFLHHFSNQNTPLLRRKGKLEWAVKGYGGDWFISVTQSGNICVDVCDFFRRSEAIQTACDEVKPRHHVECCGVLRFPRGGEQGGERTSPGGNLQVGSEALPHPVSRRGLPIPSFIFLLSGSGGSF